MPSIQARIAKIALQSQPFGWAKGTIEEQRSRQEKSTRFFKIPKDIHCQPFRIDDLDAEWISCSTTKDGVILYLHGGAYALGSINIHREYLARLAAATNLKVLAINYRLAPEHPFPAALEDALLAYRWMLNQGYASSKIVMAGDSAGGGLTLASLVSLRDAGEHLPACAVCISPWVNLTTPDKEKSAAGRIDLILNFDLLEMYAQFYVGDHNRFHHLISPVFADLKGLPPMMIQIGTNEILLDQSIQITEKLHDAGVDVKLEKWDGMFHVFQIVPFLPESHKCLMKINDFISLNLPDGL